MLSKLNDNIWEGIRAGRFLTPFYFYDLKELASRYDELQQTLGQQVRILYSMKANSHPEVLRTLVRLGASIDVSSIGELEKALAAGAVANKLSFVGPGKSQGELEACLNRHVGQIVVESLEELMALDRIAALQGRLVEVLIRVNLERSWQSSGQLRQRSPSQFGIDENQIMNGVISAQKLKNVSVTGLHFHQQSQLLNSAHIVENFKISMQTLRAITEKTGWQIKAVNLGGGFGIPYFSGQSSLDLEMLKSGMQSFLAGLMSAQFKDIELLAESGRFIVGPIGVFVTKILYRKESQGKIFLICDGGFTQHQAAVGVGQMIRRAFPIQVLQESNESTQTVTLVGPSCYSMDVIAADIELPRLQSGDYIAVGQSGAYGASFSPQDFLSRPHANEYWTGMEITPEKMIG